MKKRTGVIIFNIGVVIIIIGLLLQIYDLRKENKELQELTDVQAEQIIQCSAEENALYGEYLKLEEENMVCWNKYWDLYYSGVSEYDGEYEYYE